MKLVLLRIALNAKQTYGVLMRQEGVLYSHPICVTLEDPHLGNLPNESCIPEGDYFCERVDSPHFGDVFEVRNVENRTHILFHSGNTADDTHGCILLGSSFDHKNDWITGSSQAMWAFNDLLSDLDFFSLKVCSFLGSDILKV